MFTQKDNHLYHNGSIILNSSTDKSLSEMVDTLKGYILDAEDYLPKEISRTEDKEEISRLQNELNNNQIIFEDIIAFQGGNNE